MADFTGWRRSEHGRALELIAHPNWSIAYERGSSQYRLTNGLGVVYYLDLSEALDAGRRRAAELAIFNGTDPLPEPEPEPTDMRDPTLVARGLR